MTILELLAWCKLNRVEVCISYEPRIDDEYMITMVDYTEKPARYVRRIILYEMLLRMNERDIELGTTFMLNDMLEELRSGRVRKE